MLTLLYTVFVLSGAAGLIYESIWARYLGLLVGHSAYAQVIVLAIFMGGMSAGALFAGERSTKLKSPLLWYAGVELAAGAIGLVYHDVFVAVTNLGYDRIFPALGEGPALTLVKWSMAAMLILPQSLLLGATFPLMSAGVVRLAPDIGGRSLALLYFTNSLGAAVGVLFAGFYLVALAGLPGTLVVAAVLNLTVALIVVLAVRSMRDEKNAVSSSPAAALSPASQDEPAAARILLMVAFGTAVASFIYEIAWVRMLSLVLGSATHSFELMLSAFILGLSLGAYWVRTRVDGGSMRLLAIVQLAMGALAIATLPLYLASFEWMARAMSMVGRTDSGYDAIRFIRYGLCLIVMLPATFCAGMTLPVITRLLMTQGGGERAIGRVYGVNTLGSILGVIVAGLVLMPVVGLKWLLVLGGCTDIALGVLLFVTARGSQAWQWSRTSLVGGGLVAAALVVVLFGASFDKTVLTSGVFRYGTVQAAGSADIPFYTDGRTATVSVRRSRATGVVTLATNGKPDASLGPEWLRPLAPGDARRPFLFNASTQTLSGVIPMAHMPNARDIAVIGQGSGMSTNAMLASPTIRKVVTIEIEPEMIRGSRAFYPANKRVFDDSRSEFVIDDARSYFAAAHHQYDIIVSEPSNPWVSGVSGLFTTEFYREAVKRLTDHGIFAQWFQISEIDDGLVMTVMGALAQNFKSYAVFAISGSHVMIIASKQAEIPTPDWSIVQRWAGLNEDLARIYPLTPLFFETLRITDHRAIGRLASSASVNSDFYPVLDLNAERAMFTRRDAVAFAYLGAENFSASLALGGRRNGFSDEHVAAVDGVPRLAAAVVGAKMRRAGKDSASDATRRYQALRATLASNRAPADWRAWVHAVYDVSVDLHGGSAGVADTAFFGMLDRYLKRTAPSAEALAAVRFLRSIFAWDFRAAADASGPLVAQADRGVLWLEPDLLRDGVTTAFLMVGDTAGARERFAALAPHSRRSRTDLRSLLVEAQLGLPGNP